VGDNACRQPAQQRRVRHCAGLFGTAYVNHTVTLASIA
jgi:hypothetical protein